MVRIRDLGKVSLLFTHLT